MRVSIFSNAIIDVRHPEQGMQFLKSEKFENVCLDGQIYSIEERMTGMDSENFYDGMEKAFQKTLAHLSACGLNLSAIVAPYLELNTSNASFIPFLLSKIEACIKAAEKNGCRYIIVQPIFAGMDVDKAFEKNEVFFRKLSDACLYAETKILLQNVPQYYAGHLLRGICTDEEEAAEWIDELNRITCVESGGKIAERFGYCLDTAYASVCGKNMQDMCTILGNRLRAVIISDNEGQTRTHLMPYGSAIGGSSASDYLGLIRGLREISFDGELIINASDNLAAIPTMLRYSLLSFLRKEADFFVWQIQMEEMIKRYKNIILFGAGNMCRNYMKCYGEKYKPLYICDNDRSLWNKEFCGLKVHDPNELNGISKDTAVFICNIYYEEIRQQLQQLEVQNIVYFNDEYLPSFYMNRLNRGLSR